MNHNARWITSPFSEYATPSPLFRKTFSVGKDIQSASLAVSAKGVYAAFLDGARIGDYILPPGNTEYDERIQVQTYDVTALVKKGANTLDIAVGSGWYNGTMSSRKERKSNAVIATLALTFADGEADVLLSDGSWTVGEWAVRYADLFNGEEFDARMEPHGFVPVAVEDAPTDVLIPQEGEKVVEHETLTPVAVTKAPDGSTVVDFGQNMTGYPVLTLDAKAGDVVSLSFAEVLNKDGTIYNENYRAAKCRYHYTCRDGRQTYKPFFTFYGFRYVRVDEAPSGFDPMKSLAAKVVYSDIRKTGTLKTGVAKVNQLISNIFWGQRGNFLDIPTDCPQRNERLGWTGDAQVFCKTATYNYDVEKFFTKWLGDVRAGVRLFGGSSFITPNVWIAPHTDKPHLSAAWQDACVIIPWQIYKTYGDKRVLEDNLDLMTGHIAAIEADAKRPFAWESREPHHFGDWLGMDAAPGSYRGASRADLIASAYYAFDTAIMAEVFAVLGKEDDAKAMREKHEKIRRTFIETYEDKSTTQTEAVLMLYFGLCADPAAKAAELAAMIHANGDRLTTGFVGTPYLLYALSENGYTDLAYTLLLQEAYPSWLYSVNLGATTMWEHWDGINDKGEFWSKDMNSFNHYAYGAVGGWIYETAGGITPAKPGFAEVRVAPKPDKRLERFEASIETRHGLVKSAWDYRGTDRPTYTVTVPVNAEIVIDGRTQTVSPGTYTFS